MGIVLFGSILFQRMQHTSGVAPKADFHRLLKTVVLASGSFNMLFAASMMVSGRIEVDMFILPFEVLFDEKDVMLPPLMFVYGAWSLVRRCVPTRRRHVFRLCVDILKPFFFNDRDFYTVLV